MSEIFFGLPTPHRPTSGQGQALRGFGPLLSDTQEQPCQQGSTEPLTDESHEDAIVAAGRALEAAQARYELTSDFGDAAARDQAKNEFYRLLRARSPEMVARLQAVIDARIAEGR